MPAPTPSFYGPGSSVGEGEGGRQEQEIGWKPEYAHQNTNTNQYPQVPLSPPPSYAGHSIGPYGSGNGNNAYPGPTGQPQQPLQVFAHHGPGYPPQPQGVYEQHGQVYGQQNQAGAYYSPSPSPAPGKHGKDKKYHKHSTHGHGNGSGGKYPRPGGDAPQQNVEVVYVDRRRKTRKDDVALGCCAGCATACCCCGCVVM